MAGKFKSRRASPVCHDTWCFLVKKRLRKWKNAVYLIKIRFCLFCDSLCLPLSLIFILLFSVLATDYFSVLVISVFAILLLRVSGVALLFLLPFSLSAGQVSLQFSLWLRRVGMIFCGVRISHCFSFLSLLPPFALHYSTVFPFSSTISRVVLLFLLSTSVFQQE